MSITFLKRKPIFLLYIVGVAMLATAGILSWNNFNSKPETVFWAMIDQSLSTSSVTVHSSTGDSTNGNQQTTQFSLGGQNIAHAVVSSVQPGTSVRSESIAMPDALYVKYNVATDQKNQAGKPFDFSKVNNVWSKGTSGQQQLSQELLGTDMPLGGVAVPIAYLNEQARAKLLNQIKEQGVYKTSFASAKKEKQNGRSVYVYNVSVEPVVYANMMKALAKNLGLHELDALDTKTFEGKDSFELLLTVDVHSKQLLKADAVGADIHQTYGSYDIPVTFYAPKQPVSTEELQKRIQAAQQ